MKYMKYAGLVAALALLVFVVLDPALAGKVTARGNGYAVSVVTNSVAASQVDTVVWVREPGVTALSFGLYINDTCDIDAGKVWVLRVINGQSIGVQASDTLTGITFDVNSDTSVVSAVTLAPLADQYWVVVNYTSSGVGVGGDVVARYEFIKQYSK